MVDSVDYNVGMKTETLVSEKKLVTAPAARQAAVAAEPRARSIIKIMLAAMQGFHSSSRQELLAAAKKAGYSAAEFDAALNYLVKMPVLVGSPPAAAKVAAPDAAAKSQAFDPHEAGKRLVEELQAAEGGAWTGQELNELFGLTSATLGRRRKEHRIIYWRDARHNYYYPKWQFTPTGALLPGIQEVLEFFKSLDEWRVMRYFLGPRAQLSGQRPIDLLRHDAVGKILEHAKIHAEENTW
jgi:hypothetical protein